MPRRMSNVLTLASAVVCVGSLVLVGRSFFVVDVGWVPVSHTTFAAYATDGRLVLWVGSFSGKARLSSESAVTAREVYKLWSQRVSGLPSLGIGWQEQYGVRYLVLPLWLVPILTAIPPVRWWLRRRLGSHTRGFAVVEATAEQA